MLCYPVLLPGHPSSGSPFQETKPRTPYPHHTCMQYCSCTTSIYQYICTIYTLAILPTDIGPVKHLVGDCFHPTNGDSQGQSVVGRGWYIFTQNTGVSENMAPPNFFLSHHFSYQHGDFWVYTHNLQTHPYNTSFCWLDIPVINFPFTTFPFAKFLDVYSGVVVNLYTPLCTQISPSLHFTHER